MQGISSKIKIIPIECPFLPTIASYVWNKFDMDSPDLSDILIVFPSKRNRFYFRRYLLQASHRSGIIPPTILTIPEFTDLLFERLGGKKGKVLDKLERNLILKSIVDSLKIRFWKDLNFLRFISIGDRLISFFDELQREDVTLERIEDLKESLHFPEKYAENELPIVRRIFDRYKKLLCESGYTDTEYECELFKREFKPETIEDFKYIFIAGLVAPTRLEMKVIKQILLNLPSELILHSKKSEIKDDLASPFYNHNRFIISLGASADDIDIIHICQRVAPARVYITKLKSRIQEVLYIREVLKELKGRYEPHRIAVILTNESSVSSIKMAVKEAGYDCNLSMGMPFSQTLLYSFLSLLEATVKKNFYYKEFLALIRHPLMKNAIFNGSKARPIIYEIEKKMVKENRAFFKFDDFDSEEYKPLIELIRRFTDKLTENVPFPLYVKGVEEMLSLLLSKNPDFLKSDILGIEEFLEHIRKLTKLIIEENIFHTGMEKLGFILRILKDEKYSVEGNPFKGIQLIGVLEARNLDFDCIILPSVNEGVFPKRSEKDLFVPAQLRKEVSLPYDKERENLYYYYFTQLTTGKKEVFISYVETEEGDVPSRFVSFLCDEGIRVEESPVVFKREIKKERECVQKDEFLVKRLEEMVYTPSSLRDYRECPYRFYLKHILGIGEPEKIIEEAGPREWGNIIHKALQRFYGKDFRSHFTRDNLQDARRILYSHLERVLEEKVGRPKPGGLFDLEVYKRYINRFLSEDLKRFEQGYRVYCVEKKLEDSLSVDGKMIGLKGNVDRIDVLDGKYYIIDYKTGARINKKCIKIGKDFTEFQLPLYALMFSVNSSKEIGGLIYYYISRKKTGTEDIMDKGYILAFRDEVLIPTIHEIIDPETIFSRTSDESKCRFCAYKDFCGR